MFMCWSPIVASDCQGADTEAGNHCFIPLCKEATKIFRKATSGFFCTLREVSTVKPEKIIGFSSGWLWAENYPAIILFSELPHYKIQTKFSTIIKAYKEMAKCELNKDFKTTTQRS